MTELLLTVFFAMILIPFVPGVLEVYFPRDRYPLPVDLEFSKDPRYLGKAAWSIVRRALGQFIETDGLHEVTLSKPEEVEVSSVLKVPADGSVIEIQYVRGELQSGDGAHFTGDLFVGETARLGAATTLRTLACEGDATLGHRCRVGRWLDVTGDISCGENCVLGVNAVCGGELGLGDGCEFVRLLGAPVTTPGYLTAGRDLPDRTPTPLDFSEKIRTIEDVLLLRRRDTKIEAGKSIAGSLVVKGDLELEEGAEVTGSIRAYGKVTVGEKVTVVGDIFSEKRVVVRRAAAVLGNVFSQDVVDLRPGARIGSPGRIKTVIGKKGIRLGQDVCIHGYLLTEGRGRVECKKHS